MAHLNGYEGQEMITRHNISETTIDDENRSMKMHLSGFFYTYRVSEVALVREIRDKFLSNCSVTLWRSGAWIKFHSIFTGNFEKIRYCK